MYIINLKVLEFMLVIIPKLFALKIYVYISFTILYANYAYTQMHTCQVTNHDYNYKF